MTDCNLCRNELLDWHEVNDGDTHSVCDVLFGSRSNSGKRIDCGIEDCETDLPCVHCRRFGSRIDARRAGGYTGPER